MTVNGVGSYGTFAVSGSSGRNVKSGQSVRFNFQAAGEKADNLLAGMKELDTGKRSSDRSILEDSGCFDSSYWSENMKKAAETADSEQSVTDLREEYARLLKEKSEEIFTKIDVCITKISTFLILCDLAVCLATLYVSFSLVFALMRYLQGKVFLIRFYSPTTLSSSRAEFRLPSRLACA